MELAMKRGRTTVRSVVSCCCEDRRPSDGQHPPPQSVVIAMQDELPHNEAAAQKRPLLDEQSITESQALADLKNAVKSNDITKCRDLLSEFSSNDPMLHEAVFAAVMSGHSSVLQLLLEKVADLVLQQKETDCGKTALHCAVDKKDLTCCRALLVRYPSFLKLEDRDGNTPLHNIARNNFVEACEEAMQWADTATIKYINKKKETAVHVAAMEHNDKDILRHLLEHGGRPDSRTQLLNTPLHYAMQNGFKSCVEVLLEYVEPDKVTKLFNSKTKGGCTPLMLGAKRGFTECCKLLEGTDINIQDNEGNTALHYAAIKGSMSTIDFLVEHNIDSTLKNNKGKTALWLAAACNNVECMSNLLDKSKTYYNPKDILHIAIKRKSLRCVDELLSRPPFRNVIDSQEDEGNTCLHLAIKYHSYEMAHALLNCGASMDIPNKRKEYPLHLAATISKTDNRAINERRYLLCNALLKRSYMIVNKSTVNSETPLHLAAHSGNVTTARCLILKGCSILAKNAKGYTAVQVAAMAGHEDVLQVLIKALGKKIDRREVQEHKPHPLHLAARHGHISCCQTIVKELRISNLMISDEWQQMPVDLALEHGHYDVFQYLITQMPRSSNPAADDSNFAYSVHQYCEQSITSGRESVLEAIIKSEWCSAAFANEYCASAIRAKDPQPCLAFKQLVEKHPQLACSVMDRMIVDSKDDYNLQLINFSPFEFIYYDRKGDDYSMPFSINEEIRASAKEYEGVSWSRDHPLMAASLAGHNQILQHPLTRFWLEYKMKSYTKMLLCAYVVLDVLTASSITVYFSHLRNPMTDQNYSLPYNTTQECCRNPDGDSTNPTCSANSSQLCLLYDNPLCKETLASFMTPGWNIVRTLFMFLLVFLLLCFEYNFLRRMKRPVQGKQLCLVSNFRSPVLNRTSTSAMIRQRMDDAWQDVKLLYEINADYCSIVRYTRLLLLLLFLVPTSSCHHALAIRMDWQWQTGVICVLLSWMNLVDTINRVPTFTIFMPFTFKFVKTFLKILLHIIIIIFAFSIAFHFLLKNETMFKYMTTSFIQTMVWMRGELSYQDTFMSENQKDNPSVLGSILFVVYVTTIAGFIVNLLIMHSEDQIQSYKALAKFRLADSTLRTQLMVDECFPKYRKKYSKRKIEITKQFPKPSSKQNRKASEPSVASQQIILNKTKAFDQDEKDNTYLRDKMEILLEEMEKLKNEVQKQNNKKN